MNTRKVFTEQWVESLVSRYATRPRYAQSILYVIATEERHLPLRGEIEALVAALPEPSQAKVIPRLRSARQFRPTHHELAVGGLLRELNLLTDYEKAFGSQTPDWHVHSNNDSTGFIVEVLTADVSDAEKAQNAQIGELAVRLQQIREDVGLDMSLDAGRLPLSSGESKVIAARVESWLVNDRPGLGAWLPLDKVTFRLICKGRGYSRVQLLLPGKAFSVDTTPLRTKIDEKVSKYRNLVSDTKLPLVVAVVAEFCTALDAEDFQRVMLGQVPPGLFLQESCLSGGIWASRTESGQWRMKAFLNPSAENPLPSHLFGESNQF